MLDPRDKKRVVASGEVQGIEGDLFHFKKIDEGVCKVAVWHVTDGNIKLFAPNKDDCPPQFFLNDMEGTTTLWEEEKLLGS
jgi:hypothetical protein